MKIGIDIRNAVGKKSGIGYYTMSLVTHLSKIDKKNQYFLYTSEQVNWNLGRNFTQIVRPEDSFFKKLFWILQLFLECFVWEKVDVFFSPNSLTIATISLLRRKVVLTIHDLVPIIMRGTTSENVRFFFRQLPLAIRLSKAILVPSESTKRDLLDLYNISEDKVFLTPEAAHDWCFGKTTRKAILEIKEKYNLPKRYFLFVSTLEPRKNIPNLIRGFAKFSKNDKQGFKLVIGGKKGWMYDEIFEVVMDENIKDNIIFTDYIPDEDILPLYKGATAFTFVPLMEGFGLTPLEAMATGIPVMTSNCSSLREIAGDATVLINPDSIDDIAEGMRQLAEDENLREELIEKGKKQIRKFSWKQTAQLTLDVFEKCAKSK